MHRKLQCKSQLRRNRPALPTNQAFKPSLICFEHMAPKHRRPADICTVPIPLTVTPAATPWRHVLHLLTQQGGVCPTNQDSFDKTKGDPLEQTHLNKASKE